MDKGPSHFFKVTTSSSNIYELGHVAEREEKYHFLDIKLLIRRPIKI